MRSIRAAPLIFLIAVSCKTTHEDSIKTGLFEDNISKIFKAYEEIDKCGPSPTKEELKDAKWDFGAPNIERVPGPAAFRRIFGDNFFQGAGSDKAKMRETLEEAEKFHAFFIPFRDIKVEEDRIYFSTKETHRFGDDLMIIFVFEKRENCSEVLFYKDIQYQKIDQKKSDTSFAQGLMDLIEKYGKFGSYTKELVEKFKEWMNKNKDEE